MSHPIPGHDYDEPTNPALEAVESSGEEEFDGHIRLAPKAIADDIEKLVQFCWTDDQPLDIQQAASHVEAWLATYRDDV